MLKEILKKILKNLGYKVYKFDFSYQLNKSILELYKIYNEICFKNIFELTSKRKELIQRLLGTGYGEAFYILQYLIESLELDGDICEFGVAQGATSALLANEIQNKNKILWLFDSFEGLPKPSIKDKLKNDIFNLGTIENYEGAMKYSINIVKKRLKEINFNSNKLKIIPGFIEKTINNNNFPKKVCFAYVDFDFYNPIKIALNYLDKVIIKKGIIIVDDYNFFSTGSKTAVDEFLAKSKNKYDFILPKKLTNSFCIIKRK